jgi:hypothetical protein
LNNDSIKPTGPKRLSVKDQKLSLMKDIASANIKALSYKEQAWDSWAKVVKALERRLAELKDKKYGED